MSNTPISTEVGTGLLFENERVRVWDLSLKPGESTGLHRHENDYFFVVIGGGTLQAVDEEGKEKNPSSMQDGEVHFRKLEDVAVHEARNVGDGPWRNIVVELKS